MKRHDKTYVDITLNDLILGAPIAFRRVQGQFFTDFLSIVHNWFFTFDRDDTRNYIGMENHLDYKLDYAKGTKLVDAAIDNDHRWSLASGTVPEIIIFRVPISLWNKKKNKKVLEILFTFELNIADSQKGEASRGDTTPVHYDVQTKISMAVNEIDLDSSVGVEISNSRIWFKNSLQNYFQSSGIFKKEYGLSVNMFSISMQKIKFEWDEELRESTE